MLWFVNPKNSKKMVNLTVIGSIAVKNNMIYLDDHTWMFESAKEALEVYEEMVKLSQQDRYRQVKII